MKRKKRTRKRKFVMREVAKTVQKTERNKNKNKNKPLIHASPYIFVNCERAVAQILR
jgi:hypothetical protein